MFSPKKSSNSIRYFRARFRHLTKLSVWGPIGVVSLVVLFVWELSVHPEWLTIEDDDNSSLNGNTITETLSPEEISVVSDIDSSSVLIKDLENYNKLLINPLLSSQESLLKRPKREKHKKIIKPEEDLGNPLPEINIYEAAPTDNLPSTNQLPDTKLSTSSLLGLGSINFLEQANQEEKKEEPVNLLQNAMDDYLSSKGKSESPSNYHSQSSKFNLYPTQLKPRDIKSSPILNGSKSNVSKSEEGSNYNPPLPYINITPPKPYYTDLSGGINQINKQTTGAINQINKQTNLSGYNYSPQRKPINPNLPPLIPVAPNGLANNKNEVNVVNNLGFPNSYNNQGYRQNQLQDGYQVYPNQNQNVLGTPSNNPFSSSNNSFYERGYNQRWNNPFKE